MSSQAPSVKGKAEKKSWHLAQLGQREEAEGGGELRGIERGEQKV